jgi:hypothetical protein
LYALIIFVSIPRHNKCLIAMGTKQLVAVTSKGELVLAGLGGQTTEAHHFVVFPKEPRSLLLIIRNVAARH